MNSHEKNLPITHLLLILVIASLSGLGIAFPGPSKVNTLDRYVHHYVTMVAISPDGRTIATASPNEKRVRLWDISSGKHQVCLEGESAFRCLAFSPDGKLLATGSGGWNTKEKKEFGEIKLWNPSTGRVRSTIKGYNGWPRLLAFSPDGQTLAAASGYGPLKLWNVINGKEQGPLTGAPPEKNREIRWLAFSPNGKMLASVGGTPTKDKGEVILWDLRTNRAKTSFPGLEPREHSPYQVLGRLGRDLNCVAFSKDGRTLITAGEDYRVTMWEVATCRKRADFFMPIDQNQPIILAAAVSPNGKVLAVGSFNESVIFWDITKANPGLLAISNEFWGPVGYVAFTPDGKKLAAGNGRVSSNPLSPPSKNRPMLGILEVSTAKFLLPKLESDHSIRLKEKAADKPKPVETLWEDLANPDAKKAYIAICALAKESQKAIPILKAGLHPVAEIDGKKINRLIEDLNHDQFFRRVQASKELEILGEMVELELRKLFEKGSQESRQRAKKILVKIWPVKQPEKLRTLRAIEVLEKIGNQDAQEILKTISKGNPAAWPTQEAKDSLNRLARKLP